MNILPGAVMPAIGIAMLIDTPLMFMDLLTPPIFLWTWIPVLAWGIICALIGVFTHITSNRDNNGRIINRKR